METAGFIKSRHQIDERIIKNEDVAATTIKGTPVEVTGRKPLRVVMNSVSTDLAGSIKSRERRFDTDAVHSRPAVAEMFSARSDE